MRRRRRQVEGNGDVHGSHVAGAGTDHADLVVGLEVTETACKTQHERPASHCIRQVHCPLLCPQRERLCSHCCLSQRFLVCSGKVT